MDTYLRFTNDFDGEENSYFKTPSMKKAQKLNGVCAFPFDIEGLTEEEIALKAKQYYHNFNYYGNHAVVFEREYIENNRNSEGVIVKKGRKLYEFDF